MLGKLGGLAGTGKAKRRDGVDYADLGASGGSAAWADLTDAQRSAEMKRRAKVRASSRPPKSRPTCALGVVGCAKTGEHRHYRKRA